jgi:hypothetical protein
MNGSTSIALTLNRRGLNKTYISGDISRTTPQPPFFRKLYLELDLNPRPLETSPEIQLSKV